MPANPNAKQIKISLTHFLNYITKEPEKQLTTVRDVLRQHAKGYSPPPDIYKQFRDALTELHPQNLAAPQLKSALVTLADDQHEPSRAKHYPELIRGYSKFIGKKQFTWFAPPKGQWTHSELLINLRPELGLMWGGEKWLIKLYTSMDGALNKRRAEMIIHLLREAMPTLESKAIKPAVLDVRRGKLFEPDGVNPDCTILLQSQAASFVHLYRNL